MSSSYTWQYLNVSGNGPFSYSNTTGTPPSGNVGNGVIDQITLTLIAAPEVVSQQAVFTTPPVITNIQSSSGNTITMPTTNTTLVGTDTPDNLSNKNLIDASTAIVDSIDNTKRIMFNVTGTTNTTLTLATAQTANRTLTLPDADDILVGRATTDTLTNKTLTNPVISAIVNSSATLTLPTTNDVLVGRATVDTLSNKNLVDSSVVIVDAIDNTKRIMFNVTGSTNTTLTLATAQTANRTLTLPDANDTLVGRATTDTLTNKTLTNPVIAAIVNSGATLTLPTTNDVLVGRATVDTLTNKTWNGNVIDIAYGGSGQSTKTAAFDALAPTITAGDIIVHNGTNNVRLAAPNVNDLLMMSDSTSSTGVTWRYPILTNATVFAANTVTLNSVGPTILSAMSYTIPTGQGGTYYTCFSTTLNYDNSSIVTTISIYKNSTSITASQRQYVKGTNNEFRTGITCFAVIDCIPDDIITVKAERPAGNVTLSYYSRSLTVIRIG